MKKVIVFISVLVLSIFVYANVTKNVDLEKAIDSLKKFKIEEAKRKAFLVDKMREIEQSGAQPKQNIDMVHYDFDLKIDPYQRYIGGFVTLTFIPTSSISELNFRLHKKLNLISIELDDKTVSYSRNKDDFKVSFSSSLQQGSTHKIKIEYGGEPQMTGSLGGGMLLASHEGVPSATTLSEPFEAYAWLPIIDEVSDKFTASINLTVPSDMVGASNGVLVDTVTNQDGTLTYKWVENYPISAYLISANVTNYSYFEDLYTSLDGSKIMPLAYYVYPEHLSDAQTYFSEVPDMINLYANYAGEYPFINEKYGMVEFPWGGAMEHQTLTSMGEYSVGYDFYYNNLIYAHELSHQWFGDDVTCGTWHDIWLNEGFATYFEVFWMVYEYRNYGLTVGDVFANYYDDGNVNGYMKGSVYVYNENKPFKDTGAIYDKGGWVLHMLSHVMGEDKFWTAIKTYRQRFSFSNAVTSDLQTVFEEVYGSSLQWFFDQWVYTKKRPIYSYSYSQTGNTLNLRITQKQKHKIVNRTEKKDVYIMPIDITLYYDDGSSETIVVENNQRDQLFEIPVSKTVTNIDFDKGNFILKVVKN